MADILVATKNDLELDAELRSLTQAPISFLDPSHPNISPEVKFLILKARYHDQLIADGLETGHLKIGINGLVHFTTKQPIYSIAGFIFEAFIVRLINENMLTIGKKSFEWCTERRKTKLDFIQQFKAIGTGFTTTKSVYPNYYVAQHNLDVLFLRKNKIDIVEPATILNTNNTAGIQIKAITGNEKQEIIEPILKGKYKRVLTFLRHPNNIHSYEICLNIINQMYLNGEIGLDEKNDLSTRICYPEMLGIDQRDVDDYYSYIVRWFHGEAPIIEDINLGIGLEIKGFKYANGLLLPEN